MGSCPSEALRALQTYSNMSRSGERGRLPVGGGISDVFRESRGRVFILGRDRQRPRTRSNSG